MFRRNLFQRFIKYNIIRKCGTKSKFDVHLIFDNVSCVTFFTLPLVGAVSFPVFVYEDCDFETNDFIFFPLSCVFGGLLGLAVYFSMPLIIFGVGVSVIPFGILTVMNSSSKKKVKSGGALVYDKDWNVVSHDQKDETNKLSQIDNNNKNVLSNGDEKK